MRIQSSTLCNLPAEIFENIVLELISTSPIVPLLQTCKQINHILAFPKNSHLYSRVFHHRFDSAASARRLGTRTHHSRHLAHQLVWYSSALKCIRRGDIYDHAVLDAFWACFALMSENDGKNRHHLEAAGLPDFVDEFVRNRLYEDNVSTSGWPNESPINCLALWLLWFTSTEERLKAETTARRNEIIRLVLPFVIVPFRYPSAHAPHNHFTMPLTSNSDGHLRQSILPAHGAFPLYRSGSARSTHFYDRTDLEIGIPLASTAAKLIFFSRRQVTPIGVPIHLPLNRQHAIQLGFGEQIGPTQEDVHELNQHNVVKHVPATTWDDHIDTTPTPSSQLDDDWYRLTDCIYPMEKSSLMNTHYTYGSATGLWQGRILVPTDNAFNTILQHVQMPEDFTEQQLFLNAAPLFMRLREYHCIDPQDPVPTGGANDGFDDGISNAWIPAGVQVHEDMHEGKLTFQHHGRVHVYEAYRPGLSNSHDEATCRGCQFRGTCDIVYREHDDQYLADRSQADEGVDVDVDIELLSDEDGDRDQEFLEDASAQYDSVIDTVFQQKDDDAMDEDADLVSDDDSDEEYSVQRRCNGVLDIALVGETDFKHGQAWNHYKFYGRVREWDGLVALVRIPAHPHPAAQGLGVWVFSGYIVGGQNFVGTWRALGGANPGIPTLESSFAMTRRDEGVMH
ncbi:hypothetical protein DEU56DRAFT_283244 [Suillus clintonianus]|uniref:uncharacterized protein n=1 Tax=Suillus clintonianus TaxID=1904413 RepID=UPI001B872C13|nr:uncharacterized protein DEU56DRAFT_283244 [Suillus clintonianus]KAG2141086.1 hypothetical protein DEU56DRAFT_283244 [Suillus clintonianus]